MAAWRAGTCHRTFQLVRKVAPMKQKMPLKEVAIILKAQSEETFGHFLSQSGESCKVEKMEAWFLKNKGKFGAVEPVTWDRGVKMLNVFQKDPPSYA